MTRTSSTRTCLLSWRIRVPTFSTSETRKYAKSDSCCLLLELSQRHRHPQTCAVPTLADGAGLTNVRAYFWERDMRTNRQKHSERSRPKSIEARRTFLTHIGWLRLTLSASIRIAKLPLCSMPA